MKMTDTSDAPLTSPQNPRVKGWIRAIRKRELVLIEGRHPIEAAIAAGVDITTLCMLEGSPLPEGVSVSSTASVVFASERVLGALSDTESPPRCLALASRQPLMDALANSAAFYAALPPQPRLLVLMNLQDPGNVGTLLRTARAFGCDGVVLGQPMVDVYSPKVNRSTAGWHFDLPMVAVQDWPTFVAALPTLHWQLTVGQLPKGHPIQPVAYTQLDEPPAGYGTALVLGNEGRGLLEGYQPNAEMASLLAAIGSDTEQRYTWVTIPTAVESLNVAVSGSILMAHQAATCSGAYRS